MNNYLFKLKESHIYNSIVNLPQLVLEVTDKCNLSCKYCCYSDLYKGYDQRMGMNMSFDNTKVIIDYLIDIWKENHVPGVTSPVNIGFYGGEPLLNFALIKKVIDYLEGSVNVGKKFIYNMTTNGLLLNKHIEYLVRNNFIITISFDGNEIGQSYRVDHSGCNSFQRVFNNIKYIQENFPDYFKKNVHFNTVLHNRNNIESIIDFFKFNFNTSPSISQLSSVGIRKNKINDFFNMYQNISESIDKSNYCEALEAELFLKAPRIFSLTNFIYNESGNHFITYNNLLNRNNLYKPTGTCLPFSKKMFVTVNNKILSCERISQKKSLGCIKDGQVILDMEAIAKTYNRNIFRYINQCIKCGYQEQCMHCVYQIDEKENKVCPHFCDKDSVNIAKKCYLQMISDSPDYYELLLDKTSIKY